MTIHIESLQVDHLGPLNSLQESLGQVNLIYGQNETGKTFLVEFLLHSLFRQAKSWKLRESMGTGSIQVQGLSEEPVFFSPGSHRKLEHFWEEDGVGLPLNLARLLIVKGGELDLSQGSPGGVDRDTLKSAVTSQALLDQIWESISATVRSATLEDDQIIGSNRGLIKTHGELFKERRDLENLLGIIESQYSQGPAREIETRIQIIQEKLTQQEQAKRYLAYQTWKELADLEQQRETLNEKDLRGLQDSIRDLQTLDRDIQSLESKLEGDKEQSKEYRWLEKALETWEEKNLDSKGVPSIAWGITGLASLAIGAIIMVVDKMIAWPAMIWIGTGLIAAGLLISLISGIRFYRWGKWIDDSNERQAIQEQFQEKFGSPLQSLVDLKTHKARLQEAYLSAQTRRTDLDEKIAQRRLQVQAIENAFSVLGNDPVPEDKWPAALKDLTRKSENLDQAILEDKLQLSGLNISEDAFQKEPAAVDYDPEVILQLENELGENQSRLQERQSELETLKARACERTGDDISSPWPDVLFHLQSLLKENTRAYKQLTAELVAKIGLTEILTRLRAEEDLKIVTAINTASVSTLLKKITGRYQKLGLDGDQLYVEDAFARYALSDLSTGAREQVQLALRLGIASQVCGGNPLFLILDDAFQHSDWERREALVGSTLELARNGWQVLYLSMDDHIRDLFLKIVKPELKKDFKLITLD